MNEELKNKLVAALKAKGLGEGIANLINISDESEIEGAINSLTAQLPQLTKEQKLADKEVQSEIDRRVTMALEKQKGTPTPPAPKTDNDNTPEWAKALIEQNKSLSEKINAIEQGKVTESKKSQALSLLKGSKVLTDSIKSKWENRINLDSEVPFKDQIKGLEDEFTELQQTLVDATNLAGSSPMLKNSGSASDAELDEILNKI